MLQAGVVEPPPRRQHRVLPRGRPRVRRDLPQRVRADRKPHRRAEAAARRICCSSPRSTSTVMSQRLRRRPEPSTPPDPARRALLRRGAVLGGALAAGAQARADDGLTRNLPPNVPEWSRTLGAPILASPYGVPSKFEAQRDAPREPRAHAHAAVVGVVHAAAEPVRHHHAVGPALRAPSRRHAATSIRTSIG